MAKKMIACDGNEATANVAFAVSEVAELECCRQEEYLGTGSPRV